jgi:hypothetical protein
MCWGVSRGMGRAMLDLQVWPRFHFVREAVGFFEKLFFQFFTNWGEVDESVR